jgi:sodium/bile acid cotransporter 7
MISILTGVGVALTQLSKGDQVLSLLLTVVSNLLGIVTVPFLLGIYLSSSSSITVDPVKLASNLAITVLCPTVFGIFLRKVIPAVPAFTKRFKTELSLLSTSNLVMIVWMALSTSRNNLLVQNVGEVLFVMAVAVLMHILYLAVNAVVVSSYCLNLPLKQAISVIIMASQKSSPVALAVITSIHTDNAQQKGLFAIPCIIGQLSQV